jgi:hypothetical protein
MPTYRTNLICAGKAAHRSSSVYGLKVRISTKCELYGMKVLLVKAYFREYLNTLLLRKSPKTYALKTHLTRRSGSNVGIPSGTNPVRPRATSHLAMFSNSRGGKNLCASLKPS